MNLKVDSVENHDTTFYSSKCTPISTENGFIAIVEPSSVAFWESDKSVVQLNGHKSRLLCLCVSCSDPRKYLCSCSRDKVVLWNLMEIRGDAKQGRDPVSRGATVGVDLGPVNDCALSRDNTWLALCRERDVWLVRLEHCNDVLTAVSHQTTLDTGGAPVALCRFSPAQDDLLVTADESNSFRVWSACCTSSPGRTSRKALHRASVASVGGAQRVSLCEFVPRGSHRGGLLVGSNRGELYLFAVGGSTPPRELGRVRAGLPTHSTTPLAPGSPTEVEFAVRGDENTGLGDGCEAGCVVLSALILERPDSNLRPATPSDSQLPDYLRDSGHSVLNRILSPADLLVVCSNLGVGVYDCNSWDCYTFLSFADVLGSGPCPLLVSTAVLGCPGSCPEDIRCLLSGWGGKSRVISLRLSCHNKPCHLMGSKLSFFPKCGLSAGSPLRAQVSRASGSGSSVQSSGSLYGSAPQQTKHGRQAQTKVVKSSGYGETAPRMQRFVPIINNSAPTPGSGIVRGNQASKAGRGLFERLDGRLLSTWTPPLQLKAKVCVWDEFGAAVKLAAAGDGTHLACSSGPLLTVLRWSRPSVDECVSFSGHDGRVNSLHFSTDSSWLVSGSGDGTSKVWDWRSKRCVLDIRKSEKGGNQGKDSGSVTQAAFYYMDRFILQAVKGGVELWCHQLHQLWEDNDGQRSSHQLIPGRSGANRCRRVRRIAFPTQQVTCFAAPNAFHSNVMLAGCSSRSLHVYDVDAERFLLELRDAHPRAPHCLALATPSSAVSPSPAAADLFLSASVCDGVKLWDLRQARCVQKYSRHVNRAQTSGVALSPCCRYLAVCSEDNCVYLYDTRRSHDYVDKLLGLNEVTRDVVWNPCRPQIAASALNGFVAIYATM